MCNTALNACFSDAKIDEHDGLIDMELWCVAGIPKTIDNDIGLIDRSFGFNTAVEEACKAVRQFI